MRCHHSGKSQRCHSKVNARAALAACVHSISCIASQTTDHFSHAVRAGVCCTDCNIAAAALFAIFFARTGKRARRDAAIVNIKDISLIVQL